MLYGEIPLEVRKSAKPIELAILLMYEPTWRNKKEIVYMLNYSTNRQVNKVIQRNMHWISLLRVPEDSSLLSYTVKKEHFLA